MGVVYGMTWLTEESAILLMSKVFQFDPDVTNGPTAGE